MARFVCLWIVFLLGIQFSTVGIAQTIPDDQYSVTLTNPDLPSNLVFLEWGVYIGGDMGNGCDDHYWAQGSGLGNGKSEIAICSIASGDTLYYAEYGEHQYLVDPFYYNSSIMIVPGPQGLHGDENYLIALDTNSWTEAFRIYSPWPDWSRAEEIVKSPDGKFLAIGRVSCVQIFDMHSRTNAYLFANYSGSNALSCNGGDDGIMEFSADSQRFVGYELHRYYDPTSQYPTRGVGVWDTNTWEKIGSISNNTIYDDTFGIHEFKFTSDGRGAVAITKWRWEDWPDDPNNIYQEQQVSVNSAYYYDMATRTDFWEMEPSRIEYELNTSVDGVVTRLSTSIDGGRPICHGHTNLDWKDAVNSNRHWVGGLEMMDFNGYFILKHFNRLAHWEDHPCTSSFGEGATLIFNSAGGLIHTIDIDYIWNGANELLVVDECPGTTSGTCRQGYSIVPKDVDEDGIPDYYDHFPYDSTQWNDSDGDNYGNNQAPATTPDFCPDVYGTSYIDAYGCPDFDRDGYRDDVDAFIYNPHEWADADGDLVGDNSDVFPNDSNESSDTDGDGVGDNSDVFPNDSNESVDTDGDGVGDNSDVFPNDSNESVDTDGDGVGDNSDAFPNDSSKTFDLDGNGAGENKRRIIFTGIFIICISAVFIRLRSR